MRSQGSRPTAKIEVRPGQAVEKPVRRVFPGPRKTDVPRRVAIERAPYADLIAHAKESLDVEVCGVLVGQICVDDEGQFVHVQAIIRGSAASQGATHVTFTQATWDSIHRTLEHDHPQLRIVGWYHTHPGFGVEFSEMDLFIQRNFFPGADQIGFVIDPLSGAVAIIANTNSGIEYLTRFWVDAREQTAKAPAETKERPATATDVRSDIGAAVSALEARISQLIQTQDEQRTSFHRFLYTVGFVVCLGVIGALGYTVYSQYSSRNEPPRLNNYVPVPVRIGDKTVLLGVGVVQWDVPPELDAMMLQMAKIKAEDEKKRRDLDAKSLDDNSVNPALQPKNTSAPAKPPQTSAQP